MKRFERSNGLDTALYKNYLYLFTTQRKWKQDNPGSSGVAAIATRIGTLESIMIDYCDTVFCVEPVPRQGQLQCLT